MGFMVLIILIPVFFIILHKEHKRVEEEYIKQKTMGFTHNERVFWMKLYEEAKSIGMGKDVDKYILATSKMDEADRALFILQTRTNINRQKMNELRALDEMNSDSHDSHDASSTWYKP